MYTGIYRHRVRRSRSVFISYPSELFALFSYSAPSRSISLLQSEVVGLAVTRIEPLKLAVCFMSLLSTKRLQMEDPMDADGLKSGK